MENKNDLQIKKFKFKNITDNAGFSSFASAMMAIFFGLVFGFIVMLVASPPNAVAGMKYIILGGLGRLGDVFYFATPILMTGLAVGFAFKMGLFNIGASGQYTMGMFFALYVGFMWDMPDSIHWIVAILSGMVGGMLWGLIPGIFKAFLNVNEVITSIMFNYIGMYLVDMLIKGNGTMYKSTTTRTNYLPLESQIPSLGITGTNVNLGIIFAVLIGVIIYIILQKTTFGYELKATGFNKFASEYAGMKGKTNIILTMAIAGGFAGLGGAFAILAPSGISGSSMTYEPINMIASAGFDGIAVALLGSSHPIGIIFSAIFISYIKRGGTLTSLVGYKPEIIDVVIAVIIYFSAFAAIMNSGLSRIIKSRFKNKELSHIEEDEPETTVKSKDDNTKEEE
ncbi:ABC transporter permease [Tissierella creatinophila]|uniref:Branched-chain amino acid transport system / permease component n=1 Tax=Tissierella creatinophila DSM 6911 TaxID=1123403 RepID=A0A1U7M982_TISCR|nr:ABC transporter permease [Tissierella creatinophila]OLS03845.1 branched-chain amino acid transport system / permease component [Tissierella creatinophila DSM 6911]